MACPELIANNRNRNLDASVMNINYNFYILNPCTHTPGILCVKYFACIASAFLPVVLQLLSLINQTKA